MGSVPLLLSIAAVVATTTPASASANPNWGKFFSLTNPEQQPNCVDSSFFGVLGILDFRSFGPAGRRDYCPAGGPA